MSEDPHQLYQVLRFYQDPSREREVVEGGLTLAEAREICDDPETSSSSATSPEAERLTRERGPWFYGYAKES